MLGVVAMGVQRESLPVGPEGLPGQFAWPAQALGLVVFTHGSGGGRYGLQGRHVALLLHQHHLATLLFDLHLPDTAQHATAAPDIERLARRLLGVLDWLRDAPLPHWHEQARLARRSLGLFGAGASAAAALQAAAMQPARVNAVVTRGERVDLDAALLPRVLAPTLLIVGSRDRELLRLNRQLAAQLGGAHRVEVVPGAGPAFAEPGALDTMANQAAHWFAHHAAHAPSCA